MVMLRQSTQIKVRVGPFVDVVDGFTPETAISLSAADEAELLKANGAATVDISAATWAAITGADGWYDLTLTTSHTDTVGELVVVVNDDSVCLPVYQRFYVVEEAVYDGIYAASAAGYATATNVSAVETDTQDIQTRLPAALVGGRMDSDVGAKTGNVALSAQEKLDVNAEVDTAFTTQMADSVPGDGTIPTREQAIYEIIQMLTEHILSGTTLTVRKVDGSTTLMTLTTDSATAPTSITRAT